MQFLWYFSCIYVSSLAGGLLDYLQKYMKNIPQKAACTGGLPDDEHMMFETCRGHQELN